MRFSAGERERVGARTRTAADEAVAAVALKYTHILLARFYLAALAQRQDRDEAWSSGDLLGDKGVDLILLRLRVKCVPPARVGLITPTSVSPACAR